MCRRIEGVLLMEVIDTKPSGKLVYALLTSFMSYIRYLLLMKDVSHEMLSQSSCGLAGNLKKPYKDEGYLDNTGEVGPNTGLLWTDCSLGTTLTQKD